MRAELNHSRFSIIIPVSDTIDLALIIANFAILLILILSSILREISPVIIDVVIIVDIPV